MPLYDSRAIFLLMVSKRLDDVSLFGLTVFYGRREQIALVLGRSPFPTMKTKPESARTVIKASSSTTGPIVKLTK